MTATEFPLPWEHVRWRSRRLALSDLRVVALGPDAGPQSVSTEIALYDVGAITVHASRVERLIGAGTLVIASSRDERLAIRMPRVLRARRTALTLSLLIADLRGIPPDDSIARLPLPSIWRVNPVGIPLKAALISPHSRLTWANPCCAMATPLLLANR